MASSASPTGDGTRGHMGWPCTRGTARSPPGPQGILSPSGRQQGGMCPWGWLSAGWRQGEKPLVAACRDSMRVCPLAF